MSTLPLSRSVFGREADGQNRHFGRVLALFGDHSDGVVVIVAELDHLLAERERDAVLLERGRHLIGDGLIEIIGQRAIKAVDQRGLDAGDAELLGDFRADIARPITTADLAVFAFP